MSRGTTTVSGDIKVEKSKMKWDPKTLEIRTHSVEKTLEPLVHQVGLVFDMFISSLRRVYRENRRPFTHDFLIKRLWSCCGMAESERSIGRFLDSLMIFLLSRPLSA